MVKRETDLPFTSEPATVMHVDMNSCFASVEQQANPLLRGKPIGVAPDVHPSNCILAASIEAKKLGIKTGMRIFEARKIFPRIIILEADPGKYRAVHEQLRNILDTYTPTVIPKSIDEFVLHFSKQDVRNHNLHEIAKEIKKRIYEEVGEWIRVSIGIGPNRFLAKTAAGLHKPDGLDEIHLMNVLDTYTSLSLTDLHGINIRNALRLNNAGIFSVVGMYRAPYEQLRSAFQSISAYYWYLRLRGYEIDDYETHRVTFSNSYVLPKPVPIAEALPIIRKLAEKTASRMRQEEYRARGIFVRILFSTPNKKHYGWHEAKTLPYTLFDASDLYRELCRLLRKTPQGDLVKQVALACFHVIPWNGTQLELFSNVEKKEQASAAIDEINTRWGSFTITPASTLSARNDAPDRIAFGK